MKKLIQSFFRLFISKPKVQHPTQQVDPDVARVLRNSDLMAKRFKLPPNFMEGADTARFDIG